MTPDQWIKVDQYFSNTFDRPDPALDAALQASADAGLPAISVSACQGKLLQMLARTVGAKRILEIGTLGGYSTIWMARALPPSGKLITLEYEPKHAEVARANFARAGLANQVEVRVGKALDLLPKLAGEKPAPFDLVFIDADKVSNPEYVEWALKLTRVGSIIIVDNVVRNGTVADLSVNDVSVQGVRRCIKMLADDPRVTATAMQTVGSKGYDGFAIALVVGQ